jgi:lipid A 4'-phosphatase
MRDSLWPLPALLLALALVFAFFADWPAADIAVSARFYDPATGHWWAETGLPNLVRLAIWRLAEVTVLLSVVAIGAGLWRGRPTLGIATRVWAYVLALFVAGPGLLVETVLKPLWGRARPAQIEEFGGMLLFTPPYEIANQCLKNCSFVAGEVAGATALAVAVLVLLQYRRPPVRPLLRAAGTILAPMLPLVTGAQRLAAGRHFLSDIVLSLLLVLLIALLLRPLLPPSSAARGGTN